MKNAPTPRTLAPTLLCDALADLIAACDAACERQAAQRGARLRAALHTALAAGLPAPEARAAAPQGYRRHVLHGDALGRYAIASLVWLPGQASPVHAHQVWCAYAVADGTLLESVFECTPRGASASWRGERVRSRGAITYVDAGRAQGAHRLANRSEAPAISLHVYGIAAERLSSGVNDCLPGDQGRPV